VATKSEPALRWQYRWGCRH